MFRTFILFLAIACANAWTMRSFTRQSVLKPFVDGNAFKVISGLQNFNSANVRSVVSAAEQGGATHVDIACDAQLVAMAKSICSIPVCVSSIRPIDFVPAVKAGADMLELGNFDSFYEQGLKFTADDVIAMTIQTRSWFPQIPLSVTIPHTLPLSEQVVLAQRLEECGADIIQTEGKMAANVKSMGAQEMIEVAAPTLASAYVLSRAVKIPVMCASGLTDVTAPMALTAGARGVGVGSMINKLSSQQQMLMAVTSITSAIGRSVRVGEFSNAEILSQNSVNTINTKIDA